MTTSFMTMDTREKNLSKYTMWYHLQDRDEDVSFVPSITGTFGWNLNLEGALAFLTDHPDARFVIGVRE